MKMSGYKLVAGVGFFLLFFAVTALAQSIVSVQPDSAKRGDYLEVTITGQNTHFQASSGTIIVQFTQNSSTMSMGGAILSLTQLRGILQVPIAAPLGIWNTVINDYIDPILTLPNSFRVYTDQPPAISSVTPGYALQSDSLRLTITCANTNFSVGASAVVTLTQGDQIINAVNERATNSITFVADVKIPATASGMWALNLTYPGLQTLTRVECFTVYLANAHILSIEPDTVFPGQTVLFTIDFENSAFVVGGADFAVSLWRGMTNLHPIMTPVSATRLEGTLAVPANAPVGAYNVGAYDYIHPVMTIPNGFMVIPDPTPTLTTIVPSSAKLGDTVMVTIAGHNNDFLPATGLLVLTRGVDTIAPLTIDVINFDSLEAVFAIPIAAEQGMWGITVDSPLHEVVNYPDRFQIYGPPAIIGFDPTEAGLGKAVQVTISCQNVHFTVPGYYSPVIFSHESDTIRVNAGPLTQTSLLAFLHVPPDAWAGDWDVTVPHDSACVVTMTGGFRIFSDCGDLNGSRQIDISDVVYFINFIFANGPMPVDRLQGDIDCSGRIDITDAVFAVNYIFGNGPVPCAACQ
jgi:hypothetical protein